MDLITIDYATNPSNCLHMDKYLTISTTYIKFCSVTVLAIRAIEIKRLSMLEQGNLTGY